MHSIPAQVAVTATACLCTCNSPLSSDDPAILAWGLANEPRGDRACTVVPFWADAMARHLKSLDPHHLVTLDVEGFLGPSTPDEAARSNPYNCAGSGCDFAADCGSPAIDFACAHMYPDLWLPQADDQASRVGCRPVQHQAWGKPGRHWLAGAVCACLSTISQSILLHMPTPAQERLHFALCWVDCHVALARRLGKPLVLSEWGKQRSVGGEAAATGGSPRAAFYAQVRGWGAGGWVNLQVACCACHARPGGRAAGQSSTAGTAK
jgi:mannan endo-1,4-beta-mannosidase